MITLEDCVALCGLTEEELLAIAEHEHMPEIAAAALAAYLTHQEHGTGLSPSNALELREGWLYVPTISNSVVHVRH